MTMRAARINSFLPVFLLLWMFLIVIVQAVGIALIGAFVRYEMRRSKYSRVHVSVP